MKSISKILTGSVAAVALTTSVFAAAPALAASNANGYDYAYCKSAMKNTSIVFGKDGAVATTLNGKKTTKKTLIKNTNGNSPKYIWVMQKGCAVNGSITVEEGTYVNLQTYKGSSVTGNQSAAIYNNGTINITAKDNTGATFTMNGNTAKNVVIGQLVGSNGFGTIVTSSTGTSYIAGGQYTIGAGDFAADAQIFLNMGQLNIYGGTITVANNHPAVKTGFLYVPGIEDVFPTAKTHFYGDENGVKVKNATDNSVFNATNGYTRVYEKATFYCTDSTKSLFNWDIVVEGGLYTKNCNAKKQDGTNPEKPVTPTDPCKENPNAEGCKTEPVDPCKTNPNADGCKTEPEKPVTPTKKTVLELLKANKNMYGSKAIYSKSQIYQYFKTLGYKQTEIDEALGKVTIKWTTVNAKNRAQKLIDSAKAGKWTKATLKKSLMNYGFTKAQATWAVNHVTYKK